MNKNINNSHANTNRSPMNNENFKIRLAEEVEDIFAQAQAVAVAQSIVDKLQDIAEDLSTVEAKDIMPLMDALTSNFGPEVATQFNSVATEQIRNLITAVQGAKSALDQEILRMKQGVQGGDMSDMGMMGNEPPMPGGGEEPPMDGAGPSATLPEVPPDMGGNAEDDAMGAEDNFAGRAKKESAIRKGKVIEKAEIDEWHEDTSNGKGVSMARHYGNADLSAEADARRKRNKEDQARGIGKYAIKPSPVPQKKKSFLQKLNPFKESNVAEDFLGGSPVHTPPVHTPPAEHKSAHHDDNLGNANDFHGGAGKIAHEIAAMIANEPITGNERKALSNILSHFCSVCHDPSHWGIDTETKLTAALKANGLYEINKPAVAKIVDKMRELVGTISHAHRSMTESAIRNLKNSDNPDAMILNVFRKKLAESRDAQLAAIRTARTFAIDLDDIISIVKEAAAEAKKCTACKGTGKVKGKQCFVCKGSGKSPEKKKVKEADSTNHPKKCKTCNGTGKVKGKTCPVCKGEGDLEPVKEVAKAKECPECHGKGRVDGLVNRSRVCSECHGTGKVTVKEAKEQPQQNEDGAGKFKVTYVNDKGTTISNDRFETKAAANHFASGMRKKGYKDVTLGESVAETIVNEFEMNTPKSKVGMFKGKDLGDLESQAAGLRKRIAAKKDEDHAKLTKELERVNFAIRAKKSKGGKGWHKTVESVINEEDFVKNPAFFPVGAKSATDASGGQAAPATSVQTPSPDGMPTSNVQQPQPAPKPRSTPPVGGPNQNASTNKTQSPADMRFNQAQQKSAAKMQPTMVDDGRHGTMVPPQEKEEGADVPTPQRPGMMPARQVPAQKKPTYPPEMPGRIAR